MIEYRMMNEGCVLTYCHHGGAIPLIEAKEPEAHSAWIEKKNDIPKGSVARFLKAMCQEYGSCGVMAIDGDQVIGKLRFYPAQLGDSRLPTCVQGNPKALVAFEPTSLPPQESLDSRAMSIHCIQVVKDGGYRGQGIGTTMVRKLIDWASGTGWDEIRAPAIRHIPPLLDWCGSFSIDVYKRLGFVETGSAPHPELVEGVRNMRAGHHGEDVKEQWQPFAHLSDEEAAMMYDVVFRLPEVP